MASSVTYTVTNPQARRFASAPGILAIAVEIAGAASAGTPRGATGRLAASYSVVSGRDPGTFLVRSAGVPWGKYVEYGTRHMAARAPLGRAFAGAKGRYG